MDDLIALLEKATGPDRMLDRLIGEHTYAGCGWSGDVVGLGYAKFTESIDAALTLVPDDLDWMMERYDLAFYAVVGKPDDPEYRHCGVNPAIALCIAALKARAARYAAGEQVERFGEQKA